MFNKNYVVEIPKRSDWIGNSIDLCDKGKRYSATYSPEQRRFTTSEVAADYDDIHSLLYR